MGSSRRHLRVLGAADRLSRKHRTADLRHLGHRHDGPGRADAHANEPDRVTHHLDLADDLLRRRSRQHVRVQARRRCLRAVLRQPADARGSEPRLRTPSRCGRPMRPETSGPASDGHLARSNPQSHRPRVKPNRSARSADAPPELSAKLSVDHAEVDHSRARRRALLPEVAKNSVGSFRVTLSAATTVSVRLERVSAGASARVIDVDEVQAQVRPDDDLSQRSCELPPARGRHLQSAPHGRRREVERLQSDLPDQALDRRADRRNAEALKQHLAVEARVAEQHPA